MLFPAAISDAFVYEGSSGYQSKDILENGYGYWLRCSKPDLPAPASEAEVIPSLSVPVNRGWNMIGSISRQLPVTQITSQPAGMITSRFFGYDGAYLGTEAIEPGKGYWVKVDQDGILFLSASSASSGAAGRIRVSPGSEVPPPPPSGVSDRRKELFPDRFALGQNYPNPFNPATEVSFVVANSSFVSLKVFDLTGREVVTLVDGQRAKGSYTVTWNATGYASGVYYYRMSAGTFHETRKILLLR